MQRPYVFDNLIQTLKEAREAKGMTQHELGMLVSFPQSHISKIESGSVDLRVSNLVQLARALDLELVLIPQKSLSAVQSIARSNRPEKQTHVSREAAKELQRVTNSVSKLRESSPSSDEIALLARQLRDLEHFKLSDADLAAIREAHRAVNAFFKDPNNRETLRRTIAMLNERRNVHAHKAHEDGSQAQQPAYTLDDNGNA